MTQELACQAIRFENLLGFLAGRVSGIPWLDGAKRRTIAGEVNAMRRLCTELSKTPDDSRVINEMHRIGSKIWKELYEGALQRIDLDIRGIGELDQYVDKFKQFEGLLYDSVDRYRDHVLHALWVYALGEFCFSAFASLGYDPLFVPFSCALTTDADRDLPPGYAVYEETCKSNLKALRAAKDTSLSSPEGWYRGLKRLYEMRSATWAAAALLHDIGYPLEKAIQVESLVRETLSYYGPFYPADLELHWSPIQVESVSRFLDRATEYLEFEGSIDDLLQYATRSTGKKPESRLFVVRPDQYQSSTLSESLERRQHGVLGAYLLYRLTTAFKRLYRKTISLDDEWWVATYLAKTAVLRSISAHTIETVRYDFLPQFDAYLFLIDELEDGLRIFKLPGEKRYRMRPFITYFGVNTLQFNAFQALAIGWRVVDDLIVNTEDGVRAENPERAFAMRMRKLFHFLNIEEVYKCSPLVIHLEYEQTSSKTAFVAEIGLLPPEKDHEPKVGLYVARKTTSGTVVLLEAEIDELVKRNNVRLAQPWETKKEEFLTLRLIEP